MTPSQEELEEVDRLMQANNSGYVIPENFTITVPTHNPAQKMSSGDVQKFSESSFHFLCLFNSNQEQTKPKKNSSKTLRQPTFVGNWTSRM